MSIESGHPTTSSSIDPFSSCLQSSPASGFFPRSQFFASGGQRIGVSASASVLPMNIQDWFPLGLSGLISCNPRDSQEAYPTPQFESINFSVVSFLYSPTLTYIHDYWKNHHFDYTDIFWKSNLCFLTRYLCHSFSSKEQVSFYFMAAVAIHSDLEWFLKW